MRWLTHAVASSRRFGVAGRSRTLGELVEVGATLFEVGVLAFLRFLGHVVEERGVARELLDAGEAVVGRAQRLARQGNVRVERLDGILVDSLALLMPAGSYHVALIRLYPSTVRLGSSARIVFTPTRIASLPVRNVMPYARAASPVIHLESSEARKVATVAMSPA